MPDVDRPSFTTAPTEAPTEVPTGSSGVHRIAGGYLGMVRHALTELGSGTPDTDIANAGKLVEHCQGLGIAPQICALTIYGAERHRHQTTSTTIQEPPRAGESPTREEWEVMVLRGAMDRIKAAAKKAGRPFDLETDEVIEKFVAFRGFHDDQKAADFAKAMTKTGFITTFGPRRRLLAAEPTKAEKKKPRPRSRSRSRTRR